MHLILMGPQGSGKGTQAAEVAPRLRLHHLSTGEMFRAAIASESPLGREIKAIYDRGDLITDDLTISLVEERLDAIRNGEARSGSGPTGEGAPAAVGALFDGFPRTKPQVDALDALLASRGERVGAVIFITAPEDELMKRLMARGRADDTPEGIARRLAAYREQTWPLLDVYRERGILVEVDGHQSVADVTAEVIDRLGALLGQDAVAPERVS